MTGTNEAPKPKPKPKQNGTRPGRSAMDPNAPLGVLSPPGRSAVWEYTVAAEAAGFAQQSLLDWGMAALGAAVSATVNSLAAWNEVNEPTGKLRLGLALHEPSRPLLYVQITDQGILLPDPYRSRDDAKLAVDVLEGPCVAWGASLESEGMVRTLWAMFLTRREAVAS